MQSQSKAKQRNSWQGRYPPIVIVTENRFSFFMPVSSRKYFPKKTGTIAILVLVLKILPKWDLFELNLTLVAFGKKKFGS